MENCHWGIKETLELLNFELLAVYFEELVEYVALAIDRAEVVEIVEVDVAVIVGVEAGEIG